MKWLKKFVYAVMFLMTIACTDCGSIGQMVHGIDISNLQVKRIMIEPYLSSVEIIDGTGNTIGSGTIIKNEIGKPITVITAYHVIDEMKEIYIGLSYDSNRRKMHIANTSPSLDLAIIVSDTNEKKEGPYVNIGNQRPKIGDQIWAIGNPMGEARVVTEGVIGQDKMKIEIMKDKYPVLRNLYRITAPIFSGNSGGGLFNDKGELIGVVVEMGMAAGRIIIIDDNNQPKTVTNMFCSFPEPGAFFAVSLEDVQEFILGE